MLWNNDPKTIIYGNIDGKEILQYEIVNNNGLKASIITYGATLTNLYSPDRDGNLGDVIVGFDNLDGYRQPSNPYMNAIVGRVANRINNAKFISAGETIQLNKNLEQHQLHGGYSGFDKKIWKVTDANKNSITLECISGDREEGFPGEVICSVKYELDNDNRLHIIYLARTSETTPVILTHHAYFNLSCGIESDILNHHLQITSDQILETNGDLIPTGGFIDIKNTPFDLNRSAMLRSAFNDMEGYDHFWVFGEKKKKPTLVARLSHEKSGRYIDTYTTEPGMQVYTSNGWDGQLKATKEGRSLGSHCGICLETHSHPDAMNHPHFPSPFIEKGDEYRQHTIYKFGVL